MKKILYLTLTFVFVLLCSNIISAQSTVKMEKRMVAPQTLVKTDLETLTDGSSQKSYQKSKTLEPITVMSTDSKSSELPVGRDKDAYRSSSENTSKMILKSTLRKPSRNKTN